MKKTTISIALILMLALFITWIVVSYVYSPKEEEIEESQSLFIPEPVVDVIEPEPEPEIMEVTATAYCPCQECSGGYGRQTSTGAIATEGRTIAVDPRVIPYGTEVIIDGKTYVAEDCGGAIKGNKIDIYFDDHKETEIWGVKEIGIIISETKNDEN